MPNILSHVGASLQGELCAWTVLGVINSTFDAAIFRINANLKQVWGMKMPNELALSVQRALRTMISGVVLVQCFTTHLYLAAYIMLLYPVFLEERPALVLPWLLVSAVRGLLCELLGLALGLISCLLVGATRSPCVIFVLGKLAKITPALYMWMLVFSYYRTLKMTTGLLNSTNSGGRDLDYAFELAVRRRRTKTLLAEREVRKNLTTFSYGERILPAKQPIKGNRNSYGSRVARGTSASLLSEEKDESTIISPNDQIIESHHENTGFDDWLATDLPPSRDSDQILDQFVVMLLKVAAYLAMKDAPDDFSLSHLHFSNINALTSLSSTRETRQESSLASVEPETPPYVSSSGRVGPSYIREFPKIFNKRKAEQPILRYKLSDDAENMDSRSFEYRFYPVKRENKCAQTDLSNNFGQQSFACSLSATEIIQSTPETEPIQADLSKIEPIQTELAQTDPVQTETYQSELILREPAQTAPVSVDNIQMEPFQNNTMIPQSIQFKTDPIATETNETVSKEILETRLISNGTVQIEIARNETHQSYEHNQTETVKMEPVPNNISQIENVGTHSDETQSENEQTGNIQTEPGQTEKNSES